MFELQSLSNTFNRVLTAVVVIGIMEPLAHLVKVSVPNYLAGLPIPDSIGGWFRLGSENINNIFTVYLKIEPDHIG